MFDEPETHHNLYIDEIFCYCGEDEDPPMCMKHLQTDEKNGETWTCNRCERVIHIQAEKKELEK